MRIPRKLKKKLRVCLLCLTGNPYVKKEKINTSNWFILKSDFKKWLTCFSIEDRKVANSIHIKEYKPAERKLLKQ